MDRETHSETLDRVEAMLREFPYSASRDNQSSNATMTVNAGGIGVVIAAVCCAVCLVAMFFGGLWMLHQAKQIDDLNAYLQAIYQQAPSLQPKES